MEEENVMKILVATDTHLGYKEKDSVLEKDSFISFEEIFEIAKEKEVDFVLLGGDLFHDNKPTRKTLHTCMEIMRRHCLGNRPCQVEVVSDQSVDFGHTSRTITSVNYEDPNLNISMPVFSIHGNHDDPAGTGNLSAIDIISVAGLLNHFGRTNNLDSIKISPVLLQKGTTKLALYGLGSVRDERLHRLFTKKQVSFLRPKEDTDQWFNVMVIHQNRAKHGPTNYIPEEFLDSFLDLVIWGHEHECRIEPEWNSLRNFFVVQPGSPVATSLSPGEAKKKHVALLSIHGREMKVEPIPLQTVRNMYVEDIVLSQVGSIPSPTDQFCEEAIQAYCVKRIESLLIKAEDEFTHKSHPKQPKKPLIRLRVDHSGGYPTFNPYRLGGKFSETVANADRIVHFMKKASNSQIKQEGYDVTDMDDLVVPEVVEKVKLEDLVQEYLTSKERKNQMSLLSAKGMSLAVREFVEKKEKDAVYDLCEHQIDTVTNYLKRQPSLEMEEKSYIEEIARYKDSKTSAVSAVSGTSDGNLDNEEDFHEILARVKQSRSMQGISAPTLDSDDEEVQVNAEEARTTNKSGGRGSRRGARGGGTRGGKGRGRGGRAANKKAIAVVETQPKRGSKNIMDAFKAAPQRTSTQNNEVTEILDSDDDVPVTSTKRRPTQSKRQSSHKRGRGVNFSSDEEENPFDMAVSKRRR